MKLNEIPLIGGFYKDEDRDWSVQDCVNYLPTVAETAGTRTQTMLRTAPGLRPFVRVPGAGPCRGVYNCEGRLFAVLGDMLYLIGSNGIAVPIGKIPGIQKVQFAHNQATSSGQNQLVIGNGQAGYIYNTNTKEFKRITDEGFIGGISPTFVDSYIVWVSTNRLYMLNSSVADSAEYNTLDQFQSEYSPDKLVCTIASSSELVAMSERSTEFFQNVGSNEQPFRSKGISIDLGAASRWGAVICDFSLFFLASDGTFRRIDNYNATRISTGPVEQAIRDLDWTQAQAYVWEEGRYKVVYWTFPDGYTFGWDIANGMWHRRVSYGLNRWRVSSTARWNGKTIAGDFQRGDLWVVDSNYFLEGAQEYNCEITGPYIHGDGNLVKMPRMDLIMQTGQEDQAPEDFRDQPSPPSIYGDAPNGVISIPYGPYQYTVTEGDAAIRSVSISSGSLPPGLSISNSAEISGTPASMGIYQYTAKATDTNGLYGEVSDSITIPFIAPHSSAFTDPPPETAISIAVPSGSQEGDYVFLCVSAGNAFASTPPSIIAPSGLLLLASNEFGTYFRISYFYKKLSSSDVSSGFSFTTTSGGGIVAAMYLVSKEVVDTSVAPVFTSSVSTSASPVAPSISLPWPAFVASNISRINNSDSFPSAWPLEYARFSAASTTRGSYLPMQSWCSSMSVAGNFSPGTFVTGDNQNTSSSTIGFKLRSDP